MEIKIVKLADIEADVNQPRKNFDPGKLAKLKESVKKYGIINPLIVEKNKNKYLLIDGERRFRVAKDLKLKEVKVNILETSNDIDRLISQFHIQDQHESWTALEKATAIDKLAGDLGLGIMKACQVLGIGESQGRSYVAFTKLADKEAFQRSEISFDHVKDIISTKNIARDVLAKEGEKMTLTDEKKLEKVLIGKIIDGEIKTTRDFTKIRDSFKMDYKVVQKFLKDDLTIAKMYKETNALSATNLRNAHIHANWAMTHLARYMANTDVRPNAEQIATFKQAIVKFKEFIEYME